MGRTIKLLKLESKCVNNFVRLLTNNLAKDTYKITASLSLKVRKTSGQNKYSNVRILPSVLKFVKNNNNILCPLLLLQLSLERMAGED